MRLRGWQRLRRPLLKTSVAACLLSLAVWIASFSFCLSIIRPTVCFFSVGGGFELKWYYAAPDWMNRRTTSANFHDRVLSWLVPDRRTPSIKAIVDSVPYFPEESDPNRNAMWLAVRVPAIRVVLPFWLPFSLSAAGVFLSWRIRRPRPGHCTVCYYNFTGNISGICPECGTAIRGVDGLQAG